MIVAFRQRTMRLDGVIGCLRETIPKLTRSDLHRCLERHGITHKLTKPYHPSINDQAERM